MIEIGAKIDERYRITGRIAHGGMADVYEGYDIIMRHTVAIKVMREDMMDDPKNLERFNNECIIASALSSMKNTNIVRMEGSGTVDGRPYLVNEYVEGRTLRDKLNVTMGHNVKPAEACDIMKQLAAGVTCIHSRGIIHRDIKPDNLFLMTDGSVKITDFGIASRIGELPKGEAIGGTVYYCAPEILMGKEAGIASDIYSMGIVFFEMLTGRIPFDGMTAEEIAMKQIKSKFPEPSKILTELPPALDRIIIKACRKRPEERYASAILFYEDIKDVAADARNFKEKRSWISRFFGFK